MEKDFDSWNSLKIKLDNLEEAPLFREREIWWCNIGLNIGSEIFGKGKTFTRPVLIIKKFSNHSFLGIPLSTKLKEKFGHHRFTFLDQKIDAVLSEVRKMDSKRLGSKMGKLSEKKFEEIGLILKEMIFSPHKK